MLLTAVLVVGVLVGVAIRLWLLGNQTINSDEATTGLMAHQLLHGHTSALYWGNGYGGGEPYVVAALFAVAGQSPFTLALTPALLAVAAAAIVWRIGLRLFAGPAAVAAAVLTWVWGEATVWNSVRELGFRGVTLLCGLLVILWTLRLRVALVDRRRARLDWLVLGLVAGVGWWSSPEIVYFLLPATVVLLLDLRRHWIPGTAVDITWSLLAAVVGALPWIVASVNEGFGTLRQQPAPVGYLDRLQLLFTHAAPIALGVRVEGAGDWLVPEWFGIIVLLLMGAATVGSFVVLAGHPGCRILILFVATFPSLYAAFSTTYFWNDARYAVYLPPILALLWMGALWQVAGSAARWCAALVLAAAMVSTVVAFNNSTSALNSTVALTQWSANPNRSVTALAARLEADHTKSALAEYWLANNLSFISNERVMALATDFDRNPPGTTSADWHSAERTWLLVNPVDSEASAAALGVPGAPSPGSLTLPQIDAWAQSHRVAVTSSVIGPFVIVHFDRSVSVAEVASS